MVYLNNLTTAMIERLRLGLSDYAPFAGHVDTTFGSRFKTYLSGTLPNCYLKRRKTIIVSHEDDVGNDRDVTSPASSTA